jgi:hypothetical protein
MHRGLEPCTLDSNKASGGGGLVVFPNQRDGPDSFRLYPTCQTHVPLGTVFAFALLVAVHACSTLMPLRPILKTTNGTIQQLTNLANNIHFYQRPSRENKRHGGGKRSASRVSGPVGGWARARSLKVMATWCVWAGRAGQLSPLQPMMAGADLGVQL